MGFRLLLIATKNSDRKNDFINLGVKTTNQMSDCVDNGVASTILKSEYNLYYIKDDIEPNPSIFKRVSKNCELISLFIYENMMVSYASQWKNGNLQWSILHNPEEDIQHLHIEGEAPKIIENLRKEKEKAQEGVNDVDYFFDIPGEIFKQITGYSYNRSLDSQEEKPWEILKRI